MTHSVVRHTILTTSMLASIAAGTIVTSHEAAAETTTTQAEQSSSHGFSLSSLFNGLFGKKSDQASNEPEKPAQIGASSCSNSANASISAAQYADNIRAVVDETNKVRTEHGLCAVSWDNGLAQSADEWAKHLQQSGQFEHPTQINNFSENLFISNKFPDPNAKQAVDSWMNSPGHRANLLNPDVHTIGVAIEDHNGQMPNAKVFVQRFR